jgi:hypothetical protein
VAEPGVARRHHSPPDAKVYFVYPTDGVYVTLTPLIRSSA